MYLANLEAKNIQAPKLTLINYGQVLNYLVFFNISITTKLCLAGLQHKNEGTRLFEAWGVDFLMVSDGARPSIQTKPTTPRHYDHHTHTYMYVYISSLLICYPHTH